MIMSGKTLQLLQRHISSPPSVPAILILTENRQLLKTTASKLHRRKEKKSAWKILTDRPTHTEIHTKHMQLVNTQFSSREQKRSTCMRIEQPQMQKRETVMNFTYETHTHTPHRKPGDNDRFHLLHYIFAHIMITISLYLLQFFFFVIYILFPFMRHTRRFLSLVLYIDYNYTFLLARLFNGFPLIFSRLFAAFYLYTVYSYPFQAFHCAPPYRIINAAYVM